MYRDWIDREVKTATDSVLRLMGKQAPEDALTVAPIRLADPLAPPPEASEPEPKPAGRKAARRRRKQREH